MNRSPTLPDPREQRDLVYRARGQGQDARRAMDDLVKTFGEPIVDSQLKRLDVRAGQRDDVKQAGYEAFVAAVRRHNPARTVLFEHVAKRRVRDAMLEELGVGRPQLHVEVTTEDEPDPTAGYALEEREAAVMVEEFVASLTPLQRVVVRAVFWDGMSQAEVARSRSISRMAVTNILHRVYAHGRVALAAVDPSAAKEVVPAA